MFLCYALAVRKVLETPCRCCQIFSVKICLKNIPFPYKKESFYTTSGELSIINNIQETDKHDFETQYWLLSLLSTEPPYQWLPLSISRDNLVKPVLFSNRVWELLCKQAKVKAGSPYPDSRLTLGSP